MKTCNTLIYNDHYFHLFDLKLYTANTQKMSGSKPDTSLLCFHKFSAVAANMKYCCGQSNSYLSCTITDSYLQQSKVYTQSSKFKSNAKCPGKSS